jgi:hypothetical protein
LFAHALSQFNTAWPSDNAFFPAKHFDKWKEMVSLIAGKHENHVCNQDAEARAGHWLYGQLAARLPSIGHRGVEILNERTIFRNPRLPSQSRVFCFLAKPK